MPGMVALADKLRAAMGPRERQGDRLLIERGIGYWISPDGDFVPPPPQVSHADVIRELIDRDTLDEDAEAAFLTDANAYAVSRGWTRVRIYPSQQVAYIDFGAGRRDTHRRGVARLLEQLDLAGVHVKYTDEQGNYVS